MIAILGMEKSMSARDKVSIKKLPTGVLGLDEIVGGGLPEFSFNIIAGAPGSGKTTLAHQFVFANATPERPALYFTVLGESAIKMLRYQQQYTFFDPAKLPNSIRFINLSQIVLEKDLGAVLAEIIKEVEKVQPCRRCGGLLSHDGTEAARRPQRDGFAILHPATGTVPGKLASYDFPDR